LVIIVSIKLLLFLLLFLQGEIIMMVLTHFSSLLPLKLYTDMLPHKLLTPTIKTILKMRKPRFLVVKYIVNATELTSSRDGI
jgi:hypothetical protein